MAIYTLSDNTFTEILSTPQALTNAWATVGDVIDLKDVKALTVYIKLTIHDSLNVRFRLVGMKTAAATDLFLAPLISFTSPAEIVDQHYYELNVDADQNIILKFDTDDAYLYGKLQVLAGTPGAGPGHLDAVSIMPQD